MKNKKLHSEDYFNDSRDYWWNKDFLSLMAQRLHLDRVQTILDVGSGQGHWGQLLLAFLDSDAQLTGIEPEKEWVKVATARAKKIGLESKTNYVNGSGEKLPFPNNSFDMVTCQTVLIHVEDPINVLQEMKRVLKPNGLLLAVEPNNAIGSVIFNNIKWNKPIEEITALFRFQLICEKGKEILKEGNNMRGDLLPYYFSQVHLREINSYLSDMAHFYIPPYNSLREKAGVKDSVESIKKENYLWNKKDTSRYFLAGGGTQKELLDLWGLAKKYAYERLNALEQSLLYSPGGIVFYLTSGRK